MMVLPFQSLEKCLEERIESEHYPLGEHLSDRRIKGLYFSLILRV